MNQAYQILEFTKIIQLLQDFAFTRKAKRQFAELQLILDEGKLRKQLSETSQARQILDEI